MTPNDYLFFRSLRGLATIGVLFIHASGPTITYHINSPYINVVLILNQVVRFCVPLFFFMSAYMYSIKYRNKELQYLPFVVGRLKEVGIPYLAWFLIYLIVRVVTHDIEYQSLNISSISVIFVTGQVAGHLYFIPAIFQFYLLLPIFLRVGKVIVEGNYRLLIYALLFVTSILLYHFRLLYLANQLNGQLFSQGFWIVWWVPFIMLGILYGADRKFPELKLRTLLIVMAISLIFMCYELISSFYSMPFYYNHPFKYERKDAMASFFRPSVCIYALSFLLLCMAALRKKINMNSVLLDRLGVCSFGVYLSHPLISKILLKLFKVFHLNMDYSLLRIPVVFMVGSFLTYCLVLLCDKIYFMRYVMGGSR